MPTPENVQRHSFRSSAISNATYDRMTQSLIVVFANGRSYEFGGVPPDLWEQFIQAGSPGSFYNARIRGVY